MLSWVRKLLENWFARVFFGALIMVFLFWGISNVVTLAGNNTAVAHVGGKPVDISLVQAEYQRGVNQASQSGGPPDLPARQQIARTALITVIRQQVMQQEEQRLGITVPDAALRAQIYAIPAFQTNGTFDQAKFNLVLQQNNLSPERFLVLEKSNLANNQLIQSIIAGAAPPEELTSQIFAYVTQTRIAETVTIPVAGQTLPPLPGDATLQRYWKNHPAQFTAPEYRTIKLVILSPALLAHTESVSDAEIAALYAQTTARQSLPATRSVQVIIADDAAKAARLAAIWKEGADWAKIQAVAGKAGASATELDHARQNQIPSAPLANAVFAAQPGGISGPVQGALGYFVFKVTDAQAGGAPPLSQAAAQLKQQIQLQKAQASVNQNVDNVQDALAGQTPLDQLPGNLGLTAVEGTLDDNGNTLDSTPAPIPGGASLRAAIIKAVFAAHKGDPAQLVSGPDNGYFAFTIDSVTPPALQPYNIVQAKVAAAWQQEAATRAAEIKAAALLGAVNSGKSLDDAASAAGESVAMTAPMTRSAPPSGLPADMVPVIFTLTPGQATMQQTATGFIVAALAKISQPSPADDPQDAASIQQAMTQALQNDLAESFVAGAQARAKVSVNSKLFAQITQ